MKRGNTALKRGVGLASAFALAIAGAVVAAPAASAAPAATSGVRATPIANAPFIVGGALISKISDYAVDGSTYSAAGTGAVPVVGVGDSQAVSGLQTFIPVSAGTGTKSFAAGDTFTISLTGAEFSGTPTVDITRTPVYAVSVPASNVVGLDVAAGWSGANLFGSPRATEATAAKALSGKSVSSLPANKAQRITAKVNATDASKLDVTLEADGNNNLADNVDALATGAPGYLITVSNINVKVKDTAQTAPIVASDGTASTTIGYVSPFSITTPAGSGYTVLKNGDVELPNISIAETAKDAFDNGTGVTFTLEASGDAQEKVPAPTVQFNAAGSASKVNGKDVDASLTGGVLGVDVPKTSTDATDATKLESTTVSGSVVSGLKAGADLTVTVAGATSGATNTVAGVLKSYTPAQASVISLTIKQNSSAPRIAGTNRYATAGDIAARLADGSPLNAVVLANGTTVKNGFDALSANYLAGAHDAAILLTDSSDTLPQATQDALVKVLKGSAGADNTVTIYALGATDSVSAAALSKAEFLAKAAVNSGVTVKTVRLAGANRYKTSAAVVNEPGKANVGSYNLGKGSLNTAFLANGTVNADALAAGAIAAGASIPVLLTDGKTLDADVAKSIKDNDIKQIIVLGGTDRVSADLVKALSDDNGVTNVVRVAGSDRYATAADLAAFAIKTPADGGLNLDLGSTAYLANGTDGFPDALAVGPLAGSTSSALLTVPVKDLPKSTSDFLSATANKAVITWIEALGSTDRISDELVAAAQKAIGF